MSSLLASRLPDFSSTSIDELAQEDVQRALQEDAGSGDLTAALVPADARSTARVLLRESATLCGVPWVEAVIQTLDPKASIRWLRAEGERCQPGDLVLELHGRAQALLTGERTALNFLQLLSAVATLTAAYVEAVNGTRARIVDTRARRCPAFASRRSTPSERAAA